MKIHSEKYSTWYMKIIWKIQYKLADAKIKCRTRPDSQVTTLWIFHIVKDDVYFLFYGFTNMNSCH